MKQQKLIQYRENCIGCHACVLIAPQNWKMNHQEGKADLIGSIKKGEVSVVNLHESDLYDNMKAVEACPMSIIKIS